MKCFYIFAILAMLVSVATANETHNHEHEQNAQQNQIQAQGQATNVLANVGQPQPTNYVCPMHSHIIKDHPGKCPICGMDLVLLEQNIEQAQGVVSVPGHTQQNMALTTSQVEQGTLWRYIETFGAIEYDENGLTHVHPRATGWIENLKVKTLGEPISKGQLLYEIYAPELIVAQDDYLSLLKTGNISKQLKQRGRTRLQLLGMTEQLIDNLEQTKQSLFRVPYFAPHDGVVSELSIREGMYVNPSNKLMTIASLDNVWVLADVFEHQIDWVENGKWVEFDLPAINVYAEEGQIDYIYPALDPVTRTLKVRMSLANKSGRFKPEMIATVRIYGGPKHNAFHIPVEALIRTGKENRVIVKTDSEQFVSRKVMIGMVSQGRAEILQGLSAGELVVTSGQFLIDSESNIRSAILKLGQSAQPQAHQH